MRLKSSKSKANFPDWLPDERLFSFSILQAGPNPDALSTRGDAAEILSRLVNIIDFNLVILDMCKCLSDAVGSKLAISYLR